MPCVSDRNHVDVCPLVRRRRTARDRRTCPGGGMDLKRNEFEPALPAGWKKPLPARLPRGTYWPAVLALAMTLMLLGPVTLMPVTGVGVVLGAAALIGWIGEF